jgi:signal transduction histidine kinase
MSYFLLLLALVVVIQLIYILKIISSNRANNNYLLLLHHNTDEDNYYYYDLKGEKSHFSNHFSKLLSLDPKESLSSLKVFINETNYEVLNGLIETNIKSDIDRLHNKITLKFSLADDQAKIFQCRCHNVQNEQYQKIAILLWFEDITEDVFIKQKFNIENVKLKSEISKLNTILNTAPFPIWQRDEQQNISYFNFAYSSIISKGGDISFDTNMLEISKQAKELAKNVSEANQKNTEELYIINDGQRCLFSVTEIPFESGKTIGYGIDISAKEKIRHELEQYILAQSEFLESSASAMAIFSSDTRIKFFNQAFIKLWDLDERWLGTHPTYSQILEELREKRKLPEQANFLEFKKNHLKLFTELLTPHNEFFYLPDGTALRVLVIAHALGGLLFAYEDMTDHLTLERSYNTLIAVQKATLDQLQESIVVFGANGKLKLYNPNYCKLWNLNSDTLNKELHINEILNYNKSLFRDEMWEIYKSNLLNIISNRQQFELIIEKIDQTTIKVVGVPLPDGASLITYLDITNAVLLERSLMERNQALYDADRTKTEFLANISYEFRSPLTSILGFSEVLSKECFGRLNPKQGEYIYDITQSSQYLMNLVNDVLDLTSLEAGYLKLELSRFDIYQAISAILPIVTKRIEDKKIELIFDAVPYFGLVVGDEKRIKQVVLKLLSNAIKFNKENGKIILAINEPEPGKVEISIEDTGIGIIEEEQKLVFDKFQKSSSEKIDKSGAGLGLSVVKSFVELHHGTVSINTKKDHGTKVICIFDRENEDLTKKLDESELLSLNKVGSL